MKAPFNNNLPTQTVDVIINPGNPDSKPGDKGEFFIVTCERNAAALRSGGREG
jgi:hypothetical protein